MKKMNNGGFILAETLIVTAFVAGVLVFLYTQFTTLNTNYEYSYKYNTIEDLYALQDIKKYILGDNTAYTYITGNVTIDTPKDITDCSIFSNSSYCLRLLELENISKIIVTVNHFDYTKNIIYYNEDFTNFMKKIGPTGTEKYRIIASFKNSTYATLKF